MNYGFNASIRAIDINRDGYVDQLYAADAGGQLWRFDITQLHEGTGELVRGGVIANISGSDNSDHRRFYNEPDLALIADGGERYLTISIGSGWRANPLDEIVEDRFYMIKQYSVNQGPEFYGKSTGATSFAPITESDLVNVTESANPETNDYGWYLDFANSGEKVLGTSTTFNGNVIFSTYVPTAQVNVCSPEIGSGMAYVMDVTSGAPVFNLDDESSDELTISDRSRALNRGGIPAEATVLISADSLDNPVVLFGTEKLDIDLSNLMRRTSWADQGESGVYIEPDDGSALD